MSAPAIGLRRLETRPLTVRAKDVLLESITQGAFADGWLPPEESLAAQIGVSRTTLRAAMRSLEEEGLITRQRGVGTRINAYIAQSHLSLTRVVGFWDLITEAGYQPAIGFTRVGTGPLPADGAQRLGCAIGDPVVLVERVFLADDEPAVHVVEMIRPDYVTGSLEDMPRSVFEFAEQRCRSKVDRTVVEIIPTVANRRIADVLKLVRGTPLLRLLETQYSMEGVAFIIARIHVAHRFIRFNVVRKGF